MENNWPFIDDADNNKFLFTFQERGKMSYDEMQRTLDLGANKR